MKNTLLIIVIVQFFILTCPVFADSRQKIRVIRDTYGVPHIYADDTYSLFYGYGYVVGQDRLFQMEMMKRTTAGEVAAVLGADYAALDETVRRGFDPESLHKQIAALSATEAAVFKGYTDGLNRWIAEVEKNPGEYLPKEYIDFGFKPSTWSVYDVVLLLVGSMAHRYADFNEEVNNLVFYQQLLTQHDKAKAWQIFNATLPLYDAASPVTVPDSEAQTRDVIYQGSKPPHYLDKLAAITVNPVTADVFDVQGKYVSIVDSAARQRYFEQQFSRSGIAGPAGFSSASNVWLANKNKVSDADGVLVNGPQFGWTNPSYVYGVGLHGAGFDVVGNTLLAYPFMLFSHNGVISWGSTAGFGDLVDVYVNKIHPENAAEYFYKGQYRPLDKRTARIQVKGEQTRELDFYSTIHGRVILYDKENGYVYSKKRAWEGSEVETVLAWVELAKAQDYQAWRKQLQRMSTNINFYFLDSSGNIAYTHTGKYPIRQPGHDNRLPVFGDGSMDWQGYRPFRQNPHTYNPKQGFIVNWNNRPEHHWPNSDLWWRRWGKAERVDVLLDELNSQAQFSTKELWEINSRSSFADVNISYLLPWLERALAGRQHTKKVAESLRVLQQWDAYWWDKNADGQFDTAAPLIMQTWLTTLLKRVLYDDVGEKNFFRFASPGYPIQPIKASIPVSAGMKIIINTLFQIEAGHELDYDFFNQAAPAEVLAAVFIETIGELTAKYGDDMTHWLMPVQPLVFGRYNFRGVAQTTENNELSLPVIMNRGSENNMFIARHNHLAGWDVFAPGQSGFTHPKGQRAAHYSDQLQLYWQFKNKALPFTLKQVESMQESAFILYVQP